MRYAARTSASMTGSWAGLSLSALSLGSSSQDLDPQEGHLLGILVPRASQ